MSYINFYSLETVKARIKNFIYAFTAQFYYSLFLRTSDKNRIQRLFAHRKTNRSFEKVSIPHKNLTTNTLKHAKKPLPSASTRN